MMTEECSLCRILAKKSDGMMIKELAVSTAFLARNQAYKGYSIVVFNNHKTSLEELPDELQMQYYRDMLKISSAIINAFKPDRMNYELLGNWVPHLHWHVIPRYKTDPCWGNPIWTKLDVATRLSNKEYRQIIETLRKHL